MKYAIGLFLLLLVYTNDVLAQTDSARIFTIRNESVLWGNISRGRAYVDSFKKQTQLMLPDGYILKKAIIYFTSANFPMVETANLYTIELSKIQDLIVRCVPGSVVYIDKILAIDKNGNEVFLSSAGFVLI